MDMGRMSCRQRGTLVAAALGFVLVLLDVSVVNVALETLRVNFDTNISGLQWVVNAYTLVFAALLLTSGALGDRMGAKPVFMVGLGIFMAASLVCGLAPGLVLLVVARIVQGVGAALLVPSSLLLLRQSFPRPVDRSRAVGWWGAAGGIALAAGPVLGGLLITHVGWRSIFLINLPIGGLGMALTLRFAPVTPARPSRKLDLQGQLAAIVALASLTIALTEVAHLGWLHPGVWCGIALSFLAAIIFCWLELRTDEPMLPLTLFRNATFSIASGVGLVVNFAYYGLVFVFSLFFQSVQGLSAQQTGFAFLPMTAILVVMNIVAGRLVSRWGDRKLMVFGLVLASVGYLLLLPVERGQSYLTLGVPMLLAASGIALIVPTITNATLSSVEPVQGGIAAGVLNSARQIGGMLGVAVCGYFVRDTEPQAFLHGMHQSIALAVVLLVLGAGVSYVGLKRHVAPGIAPSECPLH